MSIIFLRTLILYLIIVVCIRIMGRRQVGQLQPSELVITILISNIATLPIEDNNIPLIAGIIPILVLVSMEVIMSSITLHNKRLRHLISGTTRTIIYKGEILQDEMAKIRFSIDDVMEELRTQSIFDISEVEYAVVETNGKINVYKKFANQNPINKQFDFKPTLEQVMPPVIIISDGFIVANNLKYCNIQESWVKGILNQKKILLKDVFIMTCTTTLDYSIILRNIEKNISEKSGG